MAKKETYNEGKASVAFDSDTFLNPIARPTRDMGIAIAALDGAGKPGFRVLDATGGTGIRGIRYGLEAGANDVTILEINEKAFKTAKGNASSNYPDARVINTSIQEFANCANERFDLIDLDPFGGIVPYVYDIMKMARDNSFLFVTSTDSAVLCGAHYKACLKLYGAVPLHNELCHEIGLRILTGYVIRIAASFNFGIEVLVGFFYKHYMRMHMRIHYGSEQASKSIESLGFAGYCGSCGYMHLDRGLAPKARMCPNCGGALTLSGPLYIGKLKDNTLLEKVYEFMQQNGMAKESMELTAKLIDELDVPLYYSVPKLTKSIGRGSLSPARLMDALRANGYMASGSHMSHEYIKTDASIGPLKELAISLLDGGDAKPVERAKGSKK
ncbi:MAG: hypothetical protein QXW10_01945 [Candidatus Micrarchaeaceae archaeon]